jgi:hypothetical protein
MKKLYKREPKMAVINGKSRSINTNLSKEEINQLFDQVLTGQADELGVQHLVAIRAKMELSFTLMREIEGVSVQTLINRFSGNTACPKSSILFWVMLVRGLKGLYGESALLWSVNMLEKAKDNLLKVIETERASRRLKRSGSDSELDSDLSEGVAVVTSGGKGGSGASDDDLAVQLGL